MFCLFIFISIPSIEYPQLCSDLSEQWNIFFHREHDLNLTFLEFSNDASGDNCLYTSMVVEYKVNGQWRRPLNNKFCAIRYKWSFFIQ